MVNVLLVEEQNPFMKGADCTHSRGGQLATYK